MKEKLDNKIKNNKNISHKANGLQGTATDSPSITFNENCY